MIHLTRSEIFIPYDSIYFNSALEELWVASKRTPFGDGFFSVGNPIYQEKSLSKEYYSSVSITNKLLWVRFQDLYESLCMAVSKRFGIKAMFMNNLALPGFHLFSGTSHASGLWHFDLQFKKVFGQSNLDISRDVFSFTILLSEDGHEHSDLELYDLFYSDINRQILEGDEDSFESNKFLNIKYKKNQIFFHTGLQAHRIINADSFTKEYPRITMQGFGVIIDNIIYIYW